VQPSQSSNAGAEQQQIEPQKSNSSELEDTSETASDVDSNENALDYLYPAEQKQDRTRVLKPFEKIIAETRNMGSFFSLSKSLVFIEGLFERVPTPALFLILSLIIICVTVNATTQWNRHEQRLIAIDKIAANAEHKMLIYQLDDAINTLQELERTEKGDLPPRARAILNQSLWLRSYAHAKQKLYAKAIADLSQVTSVFISYDDVTDKMAEYKQLLARHPEFADGVPTANEKSKKNRTKIAARTNNTEIAAKPDEQPLPAQEKNNTPREKKLKEAKNTQPVSSEPTHSEKRLSKKSGRKTHDDAANLDNDMKRYSGLLVDYFSKAEMSRATGEKVSEPPSYEEWSNGGKPSF